MKQLRCYQLAVQFYRQAKAIKLPHHVKDQLQRAAMSIALNISEGTGKRTMKDRCHFFHIAYGSTKECQAIVDLEPTAFDESALENLDELAATLYGLIRKTSP